MAIVREEVEKVPNRWVDGAILQYYQLAANEISA
jgi:hypothetical protein